MSTTRVAATNGAIAIAIAFGLAACGGSSTPKASAPSAAMSPTGSAAASSATSAPASRGATTTAAKVSVNTASKAEITAALQRAGVANAGRWANEVVEYRPYPANDPKLTKLRTNLAKYNPGQQTIDKIVLVLKP